MELPRIGSRTLAGFPYVLLNLLGASQTPMGTRKITCAQRADDGQLAG
jgi:hypothetical protein